jgi:hypothetical protein
MKQALSLVLLATASLAHAETPCFLIPAQGAQANVAGTPVSGPMLSRACDALVVQAGSVRAVYSDTDGATHMPVINAGERFVASKASQAMQSYEDLDLNLRSGVRVAGAGPAVKRFDPVTLPAKVGADAQFQVLDEGRRIVQSGAAGAGVKIDRKGLAPGGRYVYQLLQGGKPVLASSFTLTDPDNENFVAAGLQRIDSTPGLDAAARAIARALLYEERSLSFNGMLVMQGFPR